MATGGFQPIVLVQDYQQRVFGPLDACRMCGPIETFDPDSDPLLALVLGFYLANRNPALPAEIIQLAQSRTTWDTETLENAFALGRQSGLWRRVQPLNVNYFVVGGLPETRYVLAPTMDRKPSHSPYTAYLLSLLGGLRSKEANQWISPKRQCPGYNACSLGCSV